MKKLCVIVGCISLIHFSCHKDHGSDCLILQNPGIIIPGTQGIMFKVTEIYSKLSAIRRRVEVINKKTSSLLGEVFITLGCNDPNDNLYKKINTEPENFSGQITIETNHELEYTKKILNGKLVKVEKLECKDPDPVDNTDGRCSIDSCVKNTTDDMNWLEYARCVISGPFCLPRLWANCKKICAFISDFSNPG